MTDEKKKRRIVRATTPSAACGDVGHMTVDELVAVAAHSDFEINCPICGMIHLSREEIEELEQERVVDSEEYKETTRTAIESQE